jgi:predicted transposase/invertase (TIGR01784 family)
MRRDSIFYKLFQQSPSLLFELVANPPTNCDRYRFDSVAVKEPKFEIDGVFLPPEAEGRGVVYFCEVQFQKDEQLYERLFGELFLYFYRNRDRFSDWEAVVIYPSRNTEQTDSHPYRALIGSNQLHRVYLDELGEISQLPLGLALMVLTTLTEQQAPEAAKYLLTRSREEIPQASNRAIIEIITTIMVYKFEQLSRREVEQMLGITLQQTRVYQEAKEEGREEGREEGKQEATLKLVIRQLTKRFGELSEEIRSRISGLPLPILENLSEALLDFTNLADLQAWLNAQD